MFYRSILLLICLGAALFLSFVLHRGDEKPLEVQVFTNLTFRGASLKTYKVRVHKNGLIDTISVKNAKPLSINLERNQDYVIYYVKSDSVQKCIVVDTRVPEEIKTKRFNVYIHVELDREYSRQSQDAYDLPSAIIKYNPKLKNFEYLKQYHKQVHK